VAGRSPSWTAAEAIVESGVEASGVAEDRVEEDSREMDGEETRNPL